MPLHFQTIRSSSKGNCLLVRTDQTTLIVDCGLGSMKNTRRNLAGYLSGKDQAQAVLFTHMHSDHCSYYPLRVLAEHNIRLCCHNSSVEQMRQRHCCKRPELFDTLHIEPFGLASFKVGDIIVEPFEVGHQPAFRTFGFVLMVNCAGKWKKAVIVSDFNNGLELVDAFTDADLIYVESNHDLELLRMNPNPNSRFHMPNPSTAKLLIQVLKNSANSPRYIILGHLSDQRNEPALALGQSLSAFGQAGCDIDFQLAAAPLYEPGQVFTLAD